jgi:F-type H+-transporting ATPase subunit epsilon
MLTITVNTNTESIYSGEAEEVVLPATDGFIGIMTGHLPMVCNLTFGEMTVRNKDTYEYLIIGGGLADIFENNVRVLASYAETDENINLERAKQAKERAEQRIADPKGGWDLDRAMTALTRAIKRINLAQKSSQH